MRRSLLPPLLLLAGLTSGCCSPVEPSSATAAFELRALDTQPLPAALSNTAGGRLIEVVGGSLRLQDFSRGRGRVQASAELRITDAGAAPQMERRESSGRYTRSGSVLHVVYATGATETFAIEDAGRALRTTASSCAPTSACIDVLRIHHYERVDG